LGSVSITPAALSFLAAHGSVCLSAEALYDEYGTALWTVILPRWLPNNNGSREQLFSCFTKSEVNALLKRAVFTEHPLSHFDHKEPWSGKLRWD
jgi:hypothetical protein